MHENRSGEEECMQSSSTKTVRVVYSLRSLPVHGEHHIKIGCKEIEFESISLAQLAQNNGGHRSFGLHKIKKTAEQVRFEVFTAVTMENGVFWDATPCASCKNTRLGGT
jgi:hypothetical protein